MDKVITTTFMIIISIIVSVMVFNSVYPAVNLGNASLVSMSGRLNDRLKNQVEIVHATGELDSTESWQDVNSDGDFDVYVWVKNLGSLRIPAVARTDVFFGPEGNFARIPEKDEAHGAYPYWDWQIENDTEWNPAATLRITIHSSSLLAPGRYFIKVVIPDGLSDQDYFGM